MPNMLHPAFQRFIEGDFHYRFASGPDVVQTPEQALEHGLNCVALVHLLLKALWGCHLPLDCQSIEMYYPNPHLQVVSSLQEMQMGDVIFVGRAGMQAALDAFVPRYDPTSRLTNWREFPGLHLCVYTGLHDADGSPLFIHANGQDNGVAIWSLARIQQHPRYAVLYAIKRAC